MATKSSAIQKKIETLKKGLNNKFITAAQKEKIKSQVQKLESQAKASAPKKASKPATSSSLTRLQKLVKNKKYGVYKGAGVDLQKDSDRPAKAIGKRTSKSGKTYYEYRANRIDVKQPPKRYPKLEKGGYMADGGEIYSGKDIKITIPKMGKFDEQKVVAVYDKDNFIFKIYDKDKKRVLTKMGGTNFESNLMNGSYKMDGYMADGGKIRSQEEFNELVIKKEKLVKNLSPKEIADMWNKNSNSPSKMTEEEAKMSTSKMYLRDLLVEKELTKAEYNKYFEKGGYMAKGGSLSSIKEEYEENEDNNAHSENVVLLAKHFGTKEDLVEAKRILDLHEKEGHLTSENGKKRQELHLKLIEKARTAMDKEGIEFAKGGYMADGGRVKGRNNETGESYGVVIGSVKKADEFDGGGIQMNVRNGYESRMCESTLYFDNDGNLITITDYGCAYDGNYPSTGHGSGTNYNGNKKETLEVLSKKYNPAFAKKLIELAKNPKMAEGGMVQHGLKIGDKITTDMFWDNKIVVENQKTHKRAEINLETGERKDEMAKGGYMAEGGVTEKEVVESNADMVLSQIKAVKHHAEELSNVVSRKSNIEAWVVGKIERASTDLSDITHYLEGNKDKMSMGGTVRYYAHKMDKK